jgi:hypothetical protein
MNGKLEYEYFRLQNLKRCFGIVLIARENHLLFGETNFYANVKHARRSGYSNWMVIKQIERYCEKFAYSVLTTG